jgi:TonB family protein
MKRIVFCILFTLSFAPCIRVGLCAAPPVQKPNTALGFEVVELTLRRVAQLPKREVPVAQAEMERIIRRRGVSFKLEQLSEKSFRLLGANKELLGALRGSYREAGAGGEFSTAEAKELKAAPARSLATSISAGILNGRAATLPRLIIPAAAAEAGATGGVVVRVLVDEEGDVISATAASGHPLLRKAAEAAALRVKIKPFTLDGRAVIVQGILMLNP